MILRIFVKGDYSQYHDKVHRDRRFFVVWLLFYKVYKCRIRFCGRRRRDKLQVADWLILDFDQTRFILHKFSTIPDNCVIYKVYKCRIRFGGRGRRDKLPVAVFLILDFDQKWFILHKLSTIPDNCVIQWNAIHESMICCVSVSQEFDFHLSNIEAHAVVTDQKSVLRLQAALLRDLTLDWRLHLLVRTNGTWFKFFVFTSLLDRVQILLPAIL